MSRSVLSLTLMSLVSVSSMLVGCTNSDPIADGMSSGGGDEGGAGGGVIEEGAGGAGGEGGVVDPGPAVCPDASGVYEVQPATTNLLFLLDRSGSMHLRVTGDQTRWQLTTAGFAEILQTIPEDTVAGLQMFPSGDQPVDCCFVTAGNFVDCECAAGELPGPESRCESDTYNALSVGMAPLDGQQVEEITTKVAVSDTEFYWGTPLAPALDGAIVGASGIGLEGVTSIVLLTDGLPTSCESTADATANDIQRALDAAALGAAGGVRTYVVGIDGEAASSDPATDLAVNLSAVALAGGTSRYAGCEATNDCAYLVNTDNFEQALSEALADIALEATSCSIALPEVEGGLPDYDAVNITIESGGQNVTIPRDQSHGDGWDYLPGNQQVQLYGSACDLLKSDADAKIDVVVGCTTEEI